MSKDKENKSKNIGASSIIHAIFIFLCFIFGDLRAFAANIDPLGFYRDNKTGEGFYYIGDMIEPRHNHSAIKLKDGRIFIVGGTKQNIYTKEFELLNTTEIFDINTGKSIKGPNMAHDRQNPLLFSLSNGHVLISGRSNKRKNIIEIYDPKTNTISAVGEIENLQNLNKRIAFAFEYKGNIYITCYSTVFNKFYKYNIQNKTIDVLYNKKFSGGYSNTKIIKQDNNLLYLTNQFLDIFKTDIENIDELDPHQKYINSKPKRFTDSITIFLKEKNTSYFFQKGENGIIKFFDFNTEKYVDIPETITISNVSELFELSTGNILIFLYKYPWNQHNIVEFNTKTYKVIKKNYQSPNRWATLVQIDRDKILFIGGSSTFNNLNSSKKVYVWKKGDK